VRHCQPDDGARHADLRQGELIADLGRETSYDARSMHQRALMRQCPARPRAFRMRQYDSHLDCRAAEAYLREYAGVHDSGPPGMTGSGGLGSGLPLDRIPPGWRLASLDERDGGGFTCQLIGPTGWAPIGSGPTPRAAFDAVLQVANVFRVDAGPV
jgi:hypothetical protein